MCESVTESELCEHVCIGAEVTVCVCQNMLISSAMAEFVCISLYECEFVCWVGFMSISQAICAISTCL